ncbi:sterol desaturase family protein [Agrilutibacter solisilvae]|uniref:Sterol desaturase family protein n=1 Tax=Agrilutibacter solisilvae TaxID=2763317 RepID=A0A974XX83_9GAMM|nr:sterol desaturase family protein [Lysobacter solisilvae]QSX77492.1 sterol desaturase family protein [Lysobacter solisilvae]
MKTIEYRHRYQHMYVAARYSGARHLISVAVIGLVVTGALLVYCVPLATTRDWLVVPTTLTLASFVEYWMHRGPMHHPTRGLRAVHERHGRRHHRYFAPDAMTFQNARDLHAVLFPPVLIIFFAAIATILGAVLALIWGAAAGGLFAATVIGYYLAYETLHLFYHLAERVPGRRWRWLAFLSRHHQLHHDPRDMLSCNFNLVFPIFDWLFGTLRTSAAMDPRTGERGRAGAIGQDSPDRVS